MQNPIFAVLFDLLFQTADADDCASPDGSRFGGQFFKIIQVTGVPINILLNNYVSRSDVKFRTP